MVAINTEVARVFLPLLGPARYKGVHGGRGSAKSHFFAEELVKRCVRIPGTHAVCIREVQKSLSQSAKRTIEGKIEKLGVGHLFDVQKAEIKTPGGGLIIFQGMQNHTADSIKSLEGYDIAWVEEAQSLSKTSMRLLRPTMRKPGSELWFSWNPKKKTDPVDELLRGDELPPRSIVVQANWQHNPWFGETELVEEKDFDFKRDRDMYSHVWLGEYERNSEARVFKNWRVEDFDAPPSGTILYGGADWGFSVDPTVGVICFIVGRTLYFWREVYKIGCDISRTPALFDELDPGWSPGRRAHEPEWRSLAQRVPFIADSARPETISAMNNAGYRMSPAIKGAGSVEEGIEFLRSYDVVIHETNCPRTAIEFENYSFKIDPKTDEVTNILGEKQNHVVDAGRYALENVRRMTVTRQSELRM